MILGAVPVDDFLGGRRGVAVRPDREWPILEAHHDSRFLMVSFAKGPEPLCPTCPVSDA